MGIDIFNNEERILINSVCKGELLSDFMKEDVKRSLLFSRQISNDNMIKDLLDGLLAKVDAMTDAEWDDLKMLTPFPVIEADDFAATELLDDEAEPED